MDAIIERPVDGLRQHPFIAEFPAIEDEVFEAMILGIRERGLDSPLLVTATDYVLCPDDWDRLRAARHAGLTEIACLVRPEEDAATIGIECLCLRRHYTKSALAFLAYPLHERLELEVASRRISNLAQFKDLRNSLKTPNGLSPFGEDESIKALCARLGFHQSLWIRARKVHHFLTQIEEIRAVEIRTLILSGELSLVAAMKAAGSFASSPTGTGNLDARDNHAELALKHVDSLGYQLNFFDKIDDVTREVLSSEIGKRVLTWPREILLRLRDEIDGHLVATRKKSS